MIKYRIGDKVYTLESLQSGEVVVKVQGDKLTRTFAGLVYAYNYILTEVSTYVPEVGETFLCSSTAFQGQTRTLLKNGIKYAVMNEEYELRDTFKSMQHILNTYKPERYEK